ncbi:MAG: 23S rRNA (uracil(1939)-C(5))-methyltransferase RlmD [Pygmaiobacter sp.]
MRKMMDCKFKKAGCGGCQLLDIPYDKQLETKQHMVQKLLGRFCEPTPIIGMENPLHYRCKVISTFASAKDGGLISGLYAESSHKVLPVSACLLEDEEVARVVDAVRNAAALCRYVAYDEDRGTGLLRHVLVRRGYATGQIMVVVVTATAILPSSHAFVSQLRRLCPSITTIVQNVNRRRTSVVLGDQNKVLFGPGIIEDELCGCSFWISPSSFYQVNPRQTEKLYNCAIQFAALHGQETILDAYCGTGAIGIVAAKHGAATVGGVENNREAVRDAMRNAKRNGMKNIRFYTADAGRFLHQLTAEAKTLDVVFMDPPRTGSDEHFLSALCTLSPQRIIYVSCDITTLARDLSFLVKNDYHVQKIQPVDLFPFTDHLECVVLLTRAAPARKQLD